MIRFLLMFAGAAALGATAVDGQLSVFYESSPTPIRVNYAFNETLAENPTHKFVSVPGCPSSVAGYPWVQYRDVDRDDNTYQDYSSCNFDGLKGPCPTKYSNPDRHCYLAGFQGPCPNGMTLFYKSGSDLGECDCSCTNYTTYKRHGFCLSPFTKRIVVMIPHLRRCYPLFTRGPCREGEWLIWDGENNSPICEGRRCASTTTTTGENGNSFTFQIPGTRRCLQTGKIYEDPHAAISYSYHVFENSTIPQVRVLQDEFYFADGNGGSLDFEGSDADLVPTAIFPNTGTESGGCSDGTGFSQELGICLKPFTHFK